MNTNIDIAGIRTSPAHIDAVQTLRDSFGEPEGADLTTDEDIEARDLRLGRKDGSVIHAQYEKHAEMFACFVSESAPGSEPVGTWLGAVDAPWSENLVHEEG